VYFWCKKTGRYDGKAPRAISGHLFVPEEILHASDRLPDYAAGKDVIWQNQRPTGRAKPFRGENWLHGRLISLFRPNRINTAEERGCLNIRSMVKDSDCLLRWIFTIDLA
jgi:hypothetical protein